MANTQDKPKARYYVTTYDINSGMYTPQKGVPAGPYTQFGLRQALRILRRMNYDACKGDASVLVEENAPKARRAKTRPVRLPIQPLVKRMKTPY